MLKVPCAAENSKLVFDILKQHFSEVTDSSMPLADPSHEVTMTLVKHSPDPAPASDLKCKISEKWTAKEIQEHLIENQREARTCLIPNLAGQRTLVHMLRLQR